MIANAPEPLQLTTTRLVLIHHQSSAVVPPFSATSHDAGGTSQARGCRLLDAAIGASLMFVLMYASHVGHRTMNRASTPLCNPPRSERNRVAF